MNYFNRAEGPANTRRIARRGLLVEALATCQCIAAAAEAGVWQPTGRGDDADEGTGGLLQARGLPGLTAGLGPRSRRASYRRRMEQVG